MTSGRLRSVALMLLWTAGVATAAPPGSAISHSVEFDRD
jgi:hypothetical protein